MQLQNHANAFTYDIAMVDEIDTSLLQTEKRGNGCNGGCKYNGVSSVDARAAAFMGPGPCACVVPNPVCPTFDLVIAAVWARLCKPVSNPAIFPNGPRHSKMRLRPNWFRFGAEYGFRARFWLGPVPGLVRVRAESWFGPRAGSRGARPARLNSSPVFLQAHSSYVPNHPVMPFTVHARLPIHSAIPLSILHSFPFVHSSSRLINSFVQFGPGLRIQLELTAIDLSH